jgi:hypothetical protein
MSDGVAHASLISDTLVSMADGARIGAFIWLTTVDAAPVGNIRHDRCLARDRLSGTHVGR